MKKRLLVCITTLILLSFFSLGWVSADEEENPYYSEKTIMVGEGEFVAQSIINGPPTPPSGYDFERKSVTLPQSNSIQGANSLTVPAYDWFFGCSATSGAMIAAYYDRNGYPNMYTGPTNGGVMPMDSSIWPDWIDSFGGIYEQNPLTASRNGLDGRVTRGSIDDYWIRYGLSASDPYITYGWTPHTWGDAIGDFMKTSQSGYSNSDGSTTFYTWIYSATPLTCRDMETYGIHTEDGTYGRKLFYESKGYTVTDCYNQKTDNNSGGFTYAKYKTEIDAGRPVMINLDGHTVVGVGYSDPNTVYIHDTWDYGTYSFTWGGYYSGMELLSVSIVNLTEPAAGFLNGAVLDADDGAPIVGAIVSVPGSRQTTSGADGIYALSLPAGIYTVTASALGYHEITVSDLFISEGITTTQDLLTNRRLTYQVYLPFIQR